MVNLPGDSKPLFLISALLRSLGHELRTPLSVISNELYNFSCLLPESETCLAQKRCLEISERLKKITTISPHELNFENEALINFLPKIMAINFGLTSLELSSQLKVKVAKAELGKALEIFATILCLKPTANACTYIVGPIDQGFLIHGVSKIFCEDLNSLQDFDSLTAYCLVHSETHTKEAVLADAILLGHGIKTALSLDRQSLAFKIFIPTLDDGEL